MKTDAATVVEILDDDEMEDLHLRVESPLPAVVPVPTLGWITEHRNRRRALLRDYKCACTEFESVVVRARREMRHATETLKAEAQLDAECNMSAGLLGESK